MRHPRAIRVALAALLFGIAGCTESASRAAAGPALAHELTESAPPQMPVAELAAAIRDRLDAGPAPLSGAQGPRERAELVSLYEPVAQTPLWVDPAGRPTRSARDALRVIEDAAGDGLDPGDYDAQRLGVLVNALDRDEPPSAADIAGADVAMSAAMLRYLRHLHLGRIDPRAIGFRLDVPPDGHDFVTLLRSAISDQRVAELASELAPPLAQYRLLRTMLARYRSLAGDPAMGTLPALTGTLRPGDSYDGLDALARRLAAIGDVPSGAPAPGADAVYEGSLVEAVKRFQVRHGLEPDGVIGKATQAALAVPLSWRVRQIELALERLRWLPDLGGQRFLALNIPMFHLWGWDGVPPGGSPSLGMRAIVGRALSTQTPVFVEEMRYVIFRPYWNIPRSILLNEVLPALRRDPGYLQRQNMEIVRGPGDNAQPVAATDENVALLRQGVLRLRQRPGPHNSLGLVKFVFPNTENVYLHGTPAQALFSRTRRDFSHGCVRVEDPVSLAEWVLGDQPEWTRDRILEAMSATRPQQVSLTRPIQVVLFYLTAAVMPEDGTIHFVEDIYRHDGRLDRALAAGRPAS